jgi:stage V sporulation protein R
MELISQHIKSLMESCKEKARIWGLQFSDETLEYTVTNRDLLELRPKVMIPHLYDYWVHDLEVLQAKGEYELYPNNPYETVINTRPAISFYNDNNPDWLNIMIFYHVLGHIDCFQNNVFFQKTWDYNFSERALADKRRIAQLRSEHGRWLDYVIEFARGIDNLVGYFDDLNADESEIEKDRIQAKIDYYFDIFLQSDDYINESDFSKFGYGTTRTIKGYIDEVEKFNKCIRESIGSYKDKVEIFFLDVQTFHPEFEALFEKYIEKNKKQKVDLLQFISDNSTFINQTKNIWMKDVIDIVRRTSLYFQPQIRTKILHEGFASLLHQRLFMQDERIKGHEVDFAVVDAGITSLPMIGMNPYAIGVKLFEYIEELVNTGKYSYKFLSLFDAKERKDFDTKEGKGKELLLKVRKYFSDYKFIDTFIDDDFMKKNKLFIVGRRLNEKKGTYEYYIKSKKAKDYKNKILDTLYHPPEIEINPESIVFIKDKELYLNHIFEGKPLITKYIKNVLIGIEYLWGNRVLLETSEPEDYSNRIASPFYIAQLKAAIEDSDAPIEWQRVVYSVKDKKIERKRK